MDKGWIPEQSHRTSQVVLLMILSASLVGCNRQSAANTQGEQATATTQVETVKPVRKTIQRTSE